MATMADVFGNLPGKSLEQQILWERERGLETDAAKFRDFLKWREQALASYDEWEKRGLLRKIFARKARPQVSRRPCNCIVSMRVEESPMIIGPFGIGYSVCEEHATQFGIHPGRYYEDELLSIMARIKELPS